MIFSIPFHLLNKTVFCIAEYKEKFNNGANLISTLKSTNPILFLLVDFIGRF